MKKVIVFLLIIIQAVQAYDYSESTLKNIIRGCIDSGASKKYCACMTYNIITGVPENDLSNFETSFVMALKPENSIPDKHRMVINNIKNNCSGL